MNRGTKKLAVNCLLLFQLMRLGALRSLLNYQLCNMFIRWTPLSNCPRLHHNWCWISLLDLVGTKCTMYTANTAHLPIFFKHYYTILVKPQFFLKIYFMLKYMNISKQIFRLYKRSGMYVDLWSKCLMFTTIIKRLNYLY